jgi:arylsulfatase A-like enzyme
VGAGASALALASFGCRDRSPHRKAADDRPNIVLIVVDTLRADHVYGKRAQTPNIDALARSGLSFTSVHPEAMPTVPARNSILSGRRTFPFRHWHRHDGLPEFPGWEPIERVRLSFTSALRRAGYWTGYVTDNPFVGFARPYEPLRRSFDTFVRRGGQVGGRATGVSAREIRHWIPDWLAQHAELRLRTIRYLANGNYAHDETRSFSARVFRSAADELDVARRHRPFALVVDTFEPHEPWTPPRRYVDLYGDPDYRGVEPIRQLNLPADRYLPDDERATTLERMRALYAAEVTLTDRWLGVFMDRLHDRRLESDTIVMLVSDHGFFLGEHGLTGKLSEHLHPELTHVPLIVVHPAGRRAGEWSGYRASTHDIGPTLLASAGVRPPASMDGVDLGPLLTGGAPPRREHSIGGYSDSFYVRDDQWALHGLNNGTGYRLYDLQRDPGERDDVAAAHPALVRKLHRRALETLGGRLPFYGADD